MDDETLFPLLTTCALILAGILLRRRLPSLAVRLAPTLQHANIYLLAALTLCLLAGSHNLDFGMPLLLGVGIQLWPALLGILLLKSRTALGTDLLIFSTYGGGNRGVLLLAVLYPEWLPLFILVDLGNFLSLMVLYPLAARLAKLNGGVSQHRAWYDVALLAGAVAAGLALRHSEATTWIDPAGTVIKQTLGVCVALYLGLQFDWRRLTIGPLLGRLLRARAIGIGLPILALMAASTAGMADQARALAQILALFALLPVSSIAPTLLGEGPMQRQAVADAVGTALLFVPLLGGLALLKLLLVSRPWTGF